jgi:hypothetical protein
VCSPQHIPRTARLKCAGVKSCMQRILSLKTQKLIVSGRMFVWTFFLVLVDFFFKLT